MNFYAYHVFSTLHVFYVEMATYEGGGLHIRNWETTKMKSFLNPILFSPKFKKFHYPITSVLLIGPKIQPKQRNVQKRGRERSRIM